MKLLRTLDRFVGSCVTLNKPFNLDSLDVNPLDLKEWGSLVIFWGDRVDFRIKKIQGRKRFTHKVKLLVR